MRSSSSFVLASLFAVLAAGCGPSEYDCVAKCTELEEDISAAQPSVTEPCARDAVVEATTCEQCEAAFESEFGLDPDPGFCG